ncbi:hypothetical protein [Methylopila sp. Yamaguchi]|uniref:hypothetical protein n=1 Tax=Methylopila sp. Yamaguchi TaxID=1437817 RepID=UPI000CA9488E|nr:hypothetical protein [Methylopila sp. Yamaguchi]GBD47205.1 hypothetical protein METY_0418 [Methylopila sp. Yamaguchi]
MRHLILAAAFSALALGAAHAQDKPTTPSTTDKGATSAPNDPSKTTSPKTTGAMNNTSGGVATSPQDVQRQQEGKDTAAQGGEKRPGATSVDPSKHSPGTVGATPGQQPK